MAIFNIPNLLKARANNGANGEMSFLDHLEQLRWHILRIAIAIVVLSGVAFSFKDFLFETVMFGPSKESFWTYRMMCDLSTKAPWLGDWCMTDIGFVLINTNLAGQFFLHMTASLYAGLILAFPYLLGEIWAFVSPGLTPKERGAARGALGWVALLFFTGVAFGYYILAPFSIVFLGNYQVSEAIANQVTIDSYLGTLSTLSLAAGIVFQLPVLMVVLASIGLISSAFLVKYRSHAYVILLAASAIITPSGDAATMILMGAPMVLLFEVALLAVKRIDKKKLKNGLVVQRTFEQEAPPLH